MGRRPKLASVDWLSDILFSYLVGYKRANGHWWGLFGVERLNDGEMVVTVGYKRFMVTITEV